MFWGQDIFTPLAAWAVEFFGHHHHPSYYRSYWIQIIVNRTTLQLHSESCHASCSFCPLHFSECFLHLWNPCHSFYFKQSSNDWADLKRASASEWSSPDAAANGCLWMNFAGGAAPGVGGGSPRATARWCRAGSCHWVLLRCCCRYSGRLVAVSRGRSQSWPAWDGSVCWSRSPLAIALSFFLIMKLLYFILIFPFSSINF